MLKDCEVGVVGWFVDGGCGEVNPGGLMGLGSNWNWKLDSVTLRVGTQLR